MPTRWTSFRRVSNEPRTDPAVEVRNADGQRRAIEADLGAHAADTFHEDLLPDLRADSGAARAIGYLLNDWQLSGVLTAGTGNPYDISYSFQNNGSNVNLTGSPDYGARIIYTGDPGSGCSSNQYAQFNVTSVAAPSYGSVGLESGRNQLRGCPDHTVDLALARNIRLGGGRQVQLRVDAFNAFNTVIFDRRQSQIQFNSPTDLTIRNSQTLADGSIDPTRLTPKTAGFGAATAAQGGNYLRTIQ